MKNHVLVCGALLLAATLSCTLEQDLDISRKMTFQATWADNSDTRTAIQSDGTSVWWSPAEEITVIADENTYGVFTSTNTTPQATVTFEGALESGYGGGRSVASYWAVYPHSSGNHLEGDHVWLSVESIQPGKEGTFADKAFPAVSISEGNLFTFYHVCGGARFSVANEGIGSVTFESIGGEPMAGYVTVSFEEDRPVVTSVSEYSSYSSVTVVAPEGGFVPGKYYFAAFLPGTLSQGLNVTYTKLDGTFAEIALDKSITVRRARFGTIADKDAGLTFHGYDITTPTAVDLGLSVKWASFDIGATKPAETGYYYAWGETEPKKAYGWGNYKWGKGYDNLTKYNFQEERGTVDNKMRLDEEDDVAHVKLGDKWRMPTSAELSELIDTQYDPDYQWRARVVDGVDGMEIVYLPNGNSVFFPSTGEMYGSSLDCENEVIFWSSDLGESAYTARTFDVYVGEDYFYSYSASYSRYIGLSVRPVYGDPPAIIPMESITLDRQQVTLFPGVYFNLQSEILPENTTNKVLIWSSGDESVATVDSDGSVTGVAPGTTTITASSLDKSVSATCQVTVKTPATTFATPDAVDLGLSVKWASFNVGATKPEESGNYYAWGETEPKTQFSTETYKWYDLDARQFTKYSYDSSYGPVDNKYLLDEEDDVAHMKLGGKWRMPTADEMQELLDTRYADGYQWQFKSMNGVPGFEIVCLANSNSIFLPLSGQIYSNDLTGSAYYWTTAISQYRPNQAKAGSIETYGFNGPDADYYYSLSHESRTFGSPVRPVHGDLNIIHVESVSLNHTKMDIQAGLEFALKMTLLPENATTQIVSWTSSDESVATVASSGSGYGYVTAVAPGTATITVTAADGGKTATCQVTVLDPAATFATPAAVDMGLSVKWASFNVGATKPEENGFYYAWGETEPKSSYSPSNYLWCDGEMDMLTKYNFDSASGLVDNKAKLDDADDVAHVKLGGKWRMPTFEEFLELENTQYDSGYQWTWKSQEGRYGVEITCLANGNKIFLPANGYVGDYGMIESIDENGHYWASSCTRNYLIPGQLFSLYCYDGELYSQLSAGYRANGYSVRPVYGDPPAGIPAESITLNYDKATVPQGLSLYLEATILPENTTDIVVWSSSDESVATVDSNGNVTCVAPGTATITIQTLDGKKKATCQVTVQASATTFTAPTAVDLGLSVKWGSFNLGATAPEQPGNYYGWGETEPKSSNPNQYKWYDSDGSSWDGGFTKYCRNADSGYNGFTDGKSQLDPEDDVVREKLGGKWRMPTDAEIVELIENCTWTWTTKNGMKGFQVKGRNGKSIFLPAAGTVANGFLTNFQQAGGCLSSQLEEDNDFMVRYLEFESWDNDNVYYYGSMLYRFNAMTVRPVKD